MVTIGTWDEFQRAAEELYAISPNNTRYVAKYRHDQGKLVLKVTDDRTCLKYKTDQAQDLNKFERLNRSLMAKMQNRIPTEAAATPAHGESAQVSTSASTPVPAPVPTTAVNVSSPVVSSGKKKNKKK